MSSYLLNNLVQKEETKTKSMFFKEFVLALLDFVRLSNVRNLCGGLNKILPLFFSCLVKGYYWAKLRNVEQFLKNLQIIEKNLEELRKKVEFISLLRP